MLLHEALARSRQQEAVAAARQHALVRAARGRSPVGVGSPRYAARRAERARAAAGTDVSGARDHRADAVLPWPVRSG